MSILILNWIFDHQRRRVSTRSGWIPPHRSIRRDGFWGDLSLFFINRFYLLLVVDKSELGKAGIVPSDVLRAQSLVLTQTVVQIFVIIINQWARHLLGNRGGGVRTG